MRIAEVIGRVTLSVRHPRYVGERLLLALPRKTNNNDGSHANSFAIVVYDQLGAAVGQTIAISEGREAACPFPTPVPVDAYCAALLDSVERKITSSDSTDSSESSESKLINSNPTNPTNLSNPTPPMPSSNPTTNPIPSKS